jgi:hypothetical protein
MKNTTILICALLASCSSAPRPVVINSAPSVLVQETPIPVACSEYIDASKWRAARQAFTASIAAKMEVQNSVMRAAIADAIALIDGDIRKSAAACGITIQY